MKLSDWKKASAVALLVMALVGCANTGGSKDAAATHKHGDYAKKLSHWRPLAEQGVAQAQFNLGGMYYGGEGVPQDYAKAVSWYGKAAEQGIAKAQHNLGVMYYEGEEGVPQDYAKAVSWYGKAAEQGFVEAQFSLGLMYYDGQGVPQDYTKAARWYRKAAEQGDTKAQFNLGVMYHKGQGVPQDYAEAEKWYRKAAEQGVSEAQFNLGEMYRQGLGVPQGHTEAADFTRAAQVETPEQGHVEVALAGSRGAALSAEALDAFIGLARQQDFLSSASVATHNPLAPCALLSAAFVSDLMNRMFASISHPGSINFFPPRGTNILGLYDADMVRGRGSIPRDDPNKAADILARLIVFQSWKFSTILNTLITPLTQHECLELLTNPEQFDNTLSHLRPSEAVMTHAAPIAAFIASYKREEGNLLLAELLQTSFLDKVSSSEANPFSPCLLLGAFRLAARLNDAWNNKLTKGKFDVTGRPELAPYVEDLRDIKTLKTANARAAEVLAAVFAAEILRANDLTLQLSHNATERECLDEIFEPGTLRRRLLQKGIRVPLH